jgi:tetratricopeptide (TPR) repeat protein
VNLLSRAEDLDPSADSRACELALALHIGGDTARARSLLTDIEEHAQEERVSLRARLEHAFLRSITEPDRAGALLEVASAAIPVLERAADDRALGRAWLLVAHVRGGFYCQYAPMEEAARNAVHCYQRSGWSVSTAADYLGSALLFGPTPVPNAIADLEDLARTQHDDRATEANLLMWLGRLEAMRSNFDVGRAHVEYARIAYRELGLTAAAVDSCGRALAAVELLADSPDTAVTALLNGCTLLQELGQTALLASRAGELAAAFYEQGRYDEASDWLSISREAGGDDDLDAALTRLPVEAKLLARNGDFDGAERLAAQALKLVAETGSPNRHAETLEALAEILELAGSAERAGECRTEALTLHEQKGNTAAADRLRRKTKSPVRGSSSDAVSV